MAHKGTGRNSRVRLVERKVWELRRRGQFDSNVKYAAAAKAYRTAMGVTQKEVAQYYDLGEGSVARWESGCYFGWDDLGLRDYCRVIDEIAKVA